MLLKYKKRKNINKQIAGKWTCKCMQGIFDYSKIYLFIYFRTTTICSPRDVATARVLS